MFPPEDGTYAVYAVSACRSCGSLCSAAIVCLISCEYSINCLLSAGVSVGMLAKAAAFNRLHSIHTGHTTQLEFGTYRACCAVLCCAVLCCAVVLRCVNWYGVKFCPNFISCVVVAQCMPLCMCFSRLVELMVMILAWPNLPSVINTGLGYMCPA